MSPTISQRFDLKAALIWLTAIAMGIIHLWRIQDVPWINDEPHLIIKALVANSNDTWASTGLTGSFGVAYSPIVVWFYQVLLRFTSDILAIAMVKTVFSLAMLYGAAAFLHKETKLSLCGIFLIFASPYVWFYNRIIWDNVFLIPLSLWLLAMMASFLKNPKAWKVYVSGLICVLLLHIHLMAIIPISATLATTAIARKPYLRKEWKWYLVTCVGALLSFLPYLLSLRPQVVQKSQMHSTEPFTSMTASLTGVRFFSHWKFDHLVNGCYDNPIPLTGMILTFIFAVVVFATGVILGIKNWASVIQKRKPAKQADWLSLYAGFTILIMTAFFVLTRAVPVPHYFPMSRFPREVTVVATPIAVEWFYCGMHELVGESHADNLTG